MLVILIALTGCKSEKAVVDESDQPVADGKPVLKTLSKGPPATEGFVGSAACVKCHADIADQYHGHPMAHSLAKTTEASPLEDYNQAGFSISPRLSYYVERKPEGVYHHEKLVDEAGELIYDQAMKADYAVGSGKRGRTYLVNDAGRLMESPVTWYTEKNSWALSPGYVPESNLRFDRRVSTGCIACHSGQTQVRSEEVDRFQDDPFLEESIGCERCHGPGREHIDFHSVDKPSGQDPIFNPGSVTDARRDAVCNQCHLQGRRRVVRYGRSEFDFRPGMFLSDNWVVFLKTEGVKEGTAAAVSQVEQMQASRCYVESKGQLSCISCHDAHGLPSGTTSEVFFRDKCLECHSPGKTECSEDPARRREVTGQDACTVCHMPKFPASDVHAAQTDHRVLRRPPPLSDIKRPSGPPDRKMVIYHEPGATVPEEELNRAKGIFLGERVAGNEPETKQAIDLLIATLPIAPDDIEGRFVLGKALHAAQQPQLATQAWEYILTKQPRNEDVLEELATLCHETKNLPAARHYYEKLIEVNPSKAHYYGRLAHVLGQLGDVPAAFEAAHKCLELNPSLVQTHAWLAEAYARKGDEKQAEVHGQMLNRIRGESAAPSDGI